MTRLYLKIFFSFWLITILMIVGTSLVVHWLDIGAVRHLGNSYRSSPKFPREKRLLQDVVREAINQDINNLREGLSLLPTWATSHLFIIDNSNNDLLGRQLPEPIPLLLPLITAEHPFQKQEYDEGLAFGRRIILEDGNTVSVVTLSNPHGKNILWQLFFNNVWPTLLISILISGTACFFLAKSMSRGLATLKRATQQIAAGDFSVRVTPHFHARRDEIGLLGNEFDYMTERLEKAMLEQKRLIKDVSHELRSPLARLQVALALAQQRSNGEVDQELNSIKEAAEYLNGVISDILSLPLNDNETWELNDTLDLRALLETLVTQCEPEARAKHVGLSLNALKKDALVSTHGNTLIGVFGNIIRNAIHYTLANTEISIRLDCKDSSQYRICICDQGTGVPTEELNDIFQPFYRTDEARDRASGGYGLGLAIAKRTVALHGGNIYATNNPEGGLSIIVTLPTAHFDS